MFALFFCDANTAGREQWQANARLVAILLLVPIVVLCGVYGTVPTVSPEAGDFRPFFYMVAGVIAFGTAAVTEDGGSLTNEFSVKRVFIWFPYIRFGIAVVGAVMAAFVPGHVMMVVLTLLASLCICLF